MPDQDIIQKPERFEKVCLSGPKCIICEEKLVAGEVVYRDTNQIEDKYICENCISDIRQVVER